MLHCFTTKLFDIMQQKWFYFQVLLSRVKLYQLTYFRVYLYLLLIVLNVLFFIFPDLWMFVLVVDFRDEELSRGSYAPQTLTFEGELCLSNIDFTGGS